MGYLNFSLLHHRGDLLSFAVLVQGQQHGYVLLHVVVHGLGPLIPRAIEVGLRDPETRPPSGKGVWLRNKISRELTSTKILKIFLFNVREPSTGSNYRIRVMLIRE